MIVQEGCVFSPKYLYGFTINGIEASSIESFYCALHFDTLTQQKQIAAMVPEDARLLTLNFGTKQPMWWRKYSPWGGAFLVEIEDLTGGLEELIKTAYRSQVRNSALKRDFLILAFEPFEKVQLDSLLSDELILMGLEEGRKEAHRDEYV